MGTGTILYAAGRTDQCERESTFYNGRIEQKSTYLRDDVFEDFKNLDLVYIQNDMDRKGDHMKIPITEAVFSTKSTVLNDDDDDGDDNNNNNSNINGICFGLEKGK